jgi:hypothetical protein
MKQSFKDKRLSHIKMNKILYGAMLLFICWLTSSCASRRTIAEHEDGRIYNLAGRIDKKFKIRFPGSEVLEYLDTSGQYSIWAVINVLETTCHCPPLNSRSFYNLPTIWNDRDPYLDQLSSEIAEYLLNKTGRSTIAHITVRLENDKFEKCYTSFYSVSHEQQYWNGGGPFINPQTCQYINFDFLHLERTVISQCLPGDLNKRIAGGQLSN